jgi:hypothetical protein
VSEDGNARGHEDARLETGEGDAALRRRLRRGGAAIILVGLAAAAIAYRTAAPDDDRLLIARLNNTKSYEYQMEVMGGKANILASELKDWFLGLWRGRTLGRTLAAISLGGGLACFYVAHRLAHVEKRRRDGRRAGARPAPGGS